MIPPNLEGKLRERAEADGVSVEIHSLSAAREGD
jgi:hypothetical protein